MKIAICSDTHDNLPNIDKFLAYCKNEKVKIIIHCGDWCSLLTMKHFRKNFVGKIYGVLGNVHDYDDIVQKFADKNKMVIKEDELNLVLKIVPPSPVGSVGRGNRKLKILVTHYPDKAKRFAESGEYDMVFYGHNHVPWMKKVDKTFMINPGTLAGMFNKASFGVYDTDTKKMELKIVELL